ncbi:fungal-specific transcription factor domain-containing protein [Coniochaeta sp. 2T2.1]|nr:fungal-specific transcription factor domain-containing protein [Coniochaeta sp. 2T2.1]
MELSLPILEAHTLRPRRGLGRTRRTRSFTGCWTCRSRHLKCDEAKPECNRCIQLGTKCEGYAVRLSWSESRQLRGSKPTPSPECSKTTVGLSPQSPSHRGSSPLLSSSIRNSARSADTTSTFSDTSLPRNESGQAESADQDLFVFGDIAVATHIERFLDRQQTPPPSITHLDLFPIPSHQKRLIHHWVTYLSAKMLLTDGPENESRTLILPMALAGIMSSSRESNAEITIFHAVCACSAYNLFELSGGRAAGDQVLGLKHDQLALTHLRHCIGRHEDFNSRALTEAILICVTVDTISGAPQRWRIHMAGGIAYLKDLRARTRNVRNLSACIRYLVCYAILCDWDLPEDILDFLDTTEDTPNPFHGASLQFFRNLAAMNRLLAARRFPSEEELDRLELCLLLDFPQTDMAQRGIWDHRGFAEHHAAKAFYYASLVYFNRTVRRLPLETVHSLTESGVQALEAIETVGNAHLGCMTMWPALVIASEASSPDQQLRMSSWFITKRQLGLRSQQTFLEAMNTLWLKRAQSDEPSEIRWKDIIEEERYDVFRL